jgi:hypothetical protein
MRRNGNILGSEHLPKRSSPGYSASTHLRHPRNGRTQKEYVVRVWFCDHCGLGGMTSFIEECPDCQHRQCQHCRIEEHKHHDGYAKCFREPQGAKENIPPNDNPSMIPSIIQAHRPKLSLPEKIFDIPETISPSILLKYVNWRVHLHSGGNINKRVQRRTAAC